MDFLILFYIYITFEIASRFFKMLRKGDWRIDHFRELYNIEVTRSCMRAQCSHDRIKQFKNMRERDLKENAKLEKENKELKFLINNYGLSDGVPK